MRKMNIGIEQINFSIQFEIIFWLFLLLLKITTMATRLFMIYLFVCVSYVVNLY